MQPKSVVAIITICGGASVIVLPYVVIDFLNLPEHKVSSAEWAAWAQALGTILSVAAAASISLYLQDEQRRRKHFAARALLPATLSELGDYINACLDALLDYRGNMSRTGATPRFVAPPMPISLINAMKDCVEAADEAPRKRMAELLEKLQIQNSRLSTIGLETPRVNMITTTHTINSRIVDALEIYARVDLLFPYARRLNDADPGAPRKDNMRCAASIGHFIDDQEVMQIIDWRYT
jgi:hypothetical protein